MKAAERNTSLTRVQYGAVTSTTDKVPTGLLSATASTLHKQAGTHTVSGLLQAVIAAEQIITLSSAGKRDAAPTVHELRAEGAARPCRRPEGGQGARLRSGGGGGDPRDIPASLGSKLCGHQTRQLPP